MRTALLAAALLALAGCATLPDGSRVERLPESSSTPPALTAEQSRALTELNARLLADQNAAQQAEQAREDALRRYDSRFYWGLHFGPGLWPHRGRYWNGSHWVWRPYWGIDLWGPFYP